MACAALVQKSSGLKKLAAHDFIQRLCSHYSRVPSRRSRMTARPLSTLLPQTRLIHSTSKPLYTNNTTRSTTTTKNANNATSSRIAPIAPKKAKKGGKHMHQRFEWSQEMDNKVVEMRLEGNTWEEIAEAVGVPPLAVQQRYVKNLDPSLHMGWTPRKIDLLNKYVAEGKAWRAISEELLMTPTACQEKWRMLNPRLALEAKQEEARKRALARHSQPRAQTSKSTRTSTVRLHRWHEHMDSLLIELKDRGLNWRQIGSVFGSLPLSCYTRYCGLKRKMVSNRWTPLTLNASNSPAYLLPNRRLPLTATTGIQIAGPSSNNESDVRVNGTHESVLDSKSPTAVLDTALSSTGQSELDILGFINEDLLYNTTTNTSSKIWTPAEDECIINSHESGVSFTDIAAYLNSSVKECYDRFYGVLDPKLKARAWTPILQEKLIFFVDQGVPWSIVSNYLGFHRVACRNKYRELMGLSTLQPAASWQEGSNDKTAVNKLPLATISSNADAMHNDFDDDTDANMDKFDDDDTLDDDNDDVGSDDLEDDIIEEMNDETAHQNHDYDDDDFDDENNNDNDDDDSDSVQDAMLTAAALDGRETYTDGSVTVGRRVKGPHSVAPPSYTPPEHWDKSTVMREVSKTWSAEEETTLIQHVIRHGTRGWEDVSKALDGRHSAEECRAYWKYLDMPVRRPDLGVIKWDVNREAWFWKLWLECGSDFERISQKINTVSADDEESRLGYYVRKHLRIRRTRLWIRINSTRTV
ncbi:hypothetical protein BCR41DRAFT_178771 [Lobosporangium transversale]|uniref:Homeodomain-like protein n=1 Tax=Lobosporangium transversale TaxID=64571 RepID=A0A1Y2GXD3_9FUNG|nr:hypothetical protein BCR41DRAFT_178771 [Lobosporangium transversale]ORZ26937.1 hypothetical protein BCR41DRAFT_178771 [Lobosporangium transversale]|eukprot:XP_021884684.1 hypothetical protein BCR41DRAFT_178771 [Lobosporangium transversale]